MSEDGVQAQPPPQQHNHLQQNSQEMLNQYNQHMDYNNYYNQQPDPQIQHHLHHQHQQQQLQWQSDYGQYNQGYLYQPQPQVYSQSQPSYNQYNHNGGMYNHHHNQDLYHNPNNVNNQLPPGRSPSGSHSTPSPHTQVGMLESHWSRIYPIGL